MNRRTFLSVPSTLMLAKTLSMFAGVRMISGCATKRVAPELPRIIEPPLRPVLTPQIGHTDIVTCVSLSSDSKLILTASHDGTAKLWDTDTGKLIQTFKGHTFSITSAVFSPDSKQILTASEDSSAKLWDTCTGKLIHTFQGEDAHAPDGMRVSDVATAVFSPDGTLVLTAGENESNTAKLWDTHTGKRTGVFKGGLETHSDDGYGATYSIKAMFSYDGKRILTTNSNEHDNATLWDVRTKKIIRTFQCDGKDSNGYLAVSAKFSPDDRLVLTPNGKSVQLWDTRTGKLIRTLEAHKSPVNFAVFSPDGKQILTASNDEDSDNHDNTVRLWDTSTGNLITTIKQPHKYGVAFVEYSRDGKRILTASRDEPAKLWNSSTGQLTQAFERDSNGVNPAVFLSLDGKMVLTGGDNNSARLYDANTGNLVRTLKGYTDAIDYAEFSPIGKQVLTAFTGTAKFLPNGRVPLTKFKIWDMERGTLLYTREGNMLMAAEYSPDGRNVYIYDESDGTVHISTANHGEKIKTLQREIKSAISDETVSVSYSPDGKRILTLNQQFNENQELVNAGIAKLWDTDTGKLLSTLKGHPKGVASAEFSPDGAQILTTGDDFEDKTIGLWATSTGKLIRTFQASSHVNFALFSPDGGRILAIVDNNLAAIWNVDTGKLLRTRECHTFNTRSAVISSDGKWILTSGDDNTAKLWDANTLKLIRLFKGHTDDVLSAVFSPDEKRILTVGKDKKTNLWDTQTGKLIYSLQGHVVITNGGKKLQQINSAEFSPDGKYILTTTQDQTARIWDVGTGQELCSLVAFSNGSWAVTDPQGRFDASNNGDVEGLHWVVGLETIALSQLKERYYQPGLLAKIFKGEARRPVPSFADATVALYPDVVVTPPAGGATVATIQMTNRGGGIGAVQVLVGGKEVTPDARPAGFDPDQATATLTVDLKGIDLSPVTGRDGKPLLPTLTVVARNKEGYLASRGVVAALPPAAAAPRTLPDLYAIVVGISDYAAPELHLRFAAKDARDFGQALQLGAKKLFGAEQVHMTLLTSGSSTTDAPSRRNIEQAFVEVAKKARRGDICLVYFAGHAVSFRPKDSTADASDLYCYLTADARSSDTSVLADPAVRSQTTVTSDDLTRWTTGKTGIQALKQVMILDTCAAGAVAARLVEKRDLSAEQIRALDRMKDRTGFHVLMGCASDAVSYEASRFGQGVLTYALLEGMKGAALKGGQYVDVSTLFQYAADRVPQIAKNIGGIQQPQVAAPRGTSFDVGQMGETEKRALPLSSERPLVLRPLFMNADPDRPRDDLHLSSAVAQALQNAQIRDFGAVTTARGGTAFVFVDAEGLPDAVEPDGRYTVAPDGAVTVSLSLFQGPKKLGHREVRGKSSDIPALAAAISRAIAETLTAEKTN